MLLMSNSILTTGGALQAIDLYCRGVVSASYELKLIYHYTDVSGRRKANVITRYWSEPDILKNIQFLQAKNNQGFNVYIRPVDDRFILLDDLERETLEPLAKIKPCLLMETSPGNFQAWLKFREVPENRIELSNLWKALANQFHADMGSAKPDQIGRLPGFLNMKAKYSPNFPLVKLHKYQDRECTYKIPGTIAPPVFNHTKANTKNSGRDRSGFDFAVACTLVSKNWPDAKIVEYLMQRSEKAKERGEKYLQTTIMKARKKIYR